MIAEDTFNDCLHIEHTRVKRGLFLPHQVVFRLNSQVLAQLETAKTENVSLVINPSRLTHLRFYAFLNSGLSELENFKDQQHSLESPLSPSSLIFATSYTNAELPTTVVRSQIDLKGKINQQVRQDLYNNAQLLPRIISVHHWLIAQIVQQLPAENSKSDRLIALSRLLWCVVWGLLSLCLGFYLPIPVTSKILVGICCWFLSIRYLPKIVEPKLRSWSLIYLAHSLKADKIKQSQLAWMTATVLFTN